MLLVHVAQPHWLSTDEVGAADGEGVGEKDGVSVG